MTGWRDRKPENIGAVFKPPNNDRPSKPWLLICLAISFIANFVFLLGLFGVQDISQEQSIAVQNLERTNQELLERNSALNRALGELSDALSKSNDEISGLREMIKDIQQSSENGDQ